MSSSQEFRDAWLGGPLPENPLQRVREWLDDAMAQGTEPNANSMTLATTDRDGRPSARVVLCKDLDTTDGWLTFYTNLRSPKARALRERPYAAGVFHWDRVGRQIRLAGPVTLVGAGEADAYFASRPLEAQVGAWASKQSEPIDSRYALLKKVAEVAARFHVTGHGKGRLPRPEFWGGYRIWFARVELWVARAGRVHDRGLWTRELRPANGGFAGGPWRAVHLQP